MSEFFENDHFNRIEDAELIERFLTKRVQEKKFGNVVGTYVMNLDSAWGTGKTYFLDGLEKYLQSEQGGEHLAIKINAWKDDYSDDPLPYITASITQGIKRVLKTNDSKTKPIAKNLGKIALAGGKGIAKQLLAKHVGDDGMQDVMSAMSNTAIDQAGSAILALVDQQKNAIEEFETALVQAAEEVEQAGKVAPIFVLVDELDRCRPDYAIKFLERIKHFFAVKGFVFIIATDTKQLTSAVKGAYGAEFDGERYLQRFFDRTYRFAKPNMMDFVNASFENSGLSDHKFDCLPNMNPPAFVGSVFTQSGINLREAQQILDILETCATIWHREIPLNIVCLLPKIADYYFRQDYNEITKKEARNHSFLESKFKNQDYRSIGANDAYKKIALRSIISFFMQPFDPGGARSTNEIGQWAQNVLEREYHKLRDQSGRVGKVSSLVLTYDEIVRSVGHIEKQKDQE